MNLGTQKATVTKEINRLEELQKLYMCDGFAKFVDNELRRLHGVKEDLEQQTAEEELKKKRKKRG